MITDNINVVLDQGAYMPQKAHEADAGYDLRTPTSFALSIMDNRIIDTGIHIAIPEGYVGIIETKSGLNTKFGITCTGVVDAGYTGSIRVKLYRNDINGDGLKHFDIGDKIAQIVFYPIANFELNQVDALENTERGDNGFGSSGK